MQPFITIRQASATYPVFVGRGLLDSVGEIIQPRGRIFVISSNGLRRFAETRPVHGECGGYMVLGESLEDKAGRRHAMTGLLGHATGIDPIFMSP